MEWNRERRCWGKKDREKWRTEKSGVQAVFVFNGNFTRNSLARWIPHWRTFTYSFRAETKYFLRFLKFYYYYFNSFLINLWPSKQNCSCSLSQPNHKILLDYWRSYCFYISVCGSPPLPVVFCSAELSRGPSSVSDIWNLNLRPSCTLLVTLAQPVHEHTANQKHIVWTDGGSRQLAVPILLHGSSLAAISAVQS